MKRRGAGIVVGAARERMGRELFPGFGPEARHEHVVRARELPADLRDLNGALAVGQHDLGKSDPAKAVEIEREVLSHRRILSAFGRGRRW